MGATKRALEHLNEVIGLRVAHLSGEREHELPAA
jgi:hypothetical protein